MGRRAKRARFLSHLLILAFCALALAQTPTKAKTPSAGNPGFIAATTPKPQAQFAPHYTDRIWLAHRAATEK